MSSYGAKGTRTPGNFKLARSDGMHDALVRDYAAMGGMLFKQQPPIDDVLKAVAKSHLPGPKCPERDRRVVMSF